MIAIEHYLYKPWLNSKSEYLKTYHLKSWQNLNMTNHDLDQSSVVGGHHMPTRELYLSSPQIAQGREKKMENYS